VDAIRIGRVIRALRIRRGWRQVDLAHRAGVSQSLIARVERGGADRVTIATLERVVAALGARLGVRVDWNGEAADRLFDADHAALVEAVIDVLRPSGWQALPEVTFAIGGERGSIDVMAWHRATRTLLVVEVKSVVPDVQATVAVLDRKERLASRIGRERGWEPAAVASVLVVAEGRTNRSRIAVHSSTFTARFPSDARAVRRFVKDPIAAAVPFHGLWFLSARTGAGSRQRVVRGRATP
jgi:transcriptional regulator with XRE-family HTH domain